MMLLQHSVNRDRLFNTQSRVLQADWFILEINEKATLNINMPYSENRLLKIAARDKAVLYFSLWPGVRSVSAWAPFQINFVA